MSRPLPQEGHGAHSSTSRVSAAKLARIRAGLSERDLVVLESIRSFRLMNAEQIRRLHFDGHTSVETGRRVCRRVLSRLHSLHLTRTLQRRIGGIRAGSTGQIHALTSHGHRLLENNNPESPRRRWREPSLSFTDHTLAIAELGSLAVAQARIAKLDVLGLQPEPESWRSFHDGTRPQILKPDLALQIGSESEERSWFIEVDRATESRTALQRKCQLYTTYWRSGVEQERAGLFPRVLWVAPDQRRVEVIASVFERSGVEPRLFEAIVEIDAPDRLTEP